MEVKMSNNKYQITFQDADYRAKLFCFLNSGLFFIGGKGADIIDISGTNIEFKSDSYASGNLFIEEYTILKNGSRKKGGLLKAIEDGCKYIIFDCHNPIGPKHGVYWFEVGTLLNYINSANLKRVTTKGSPPTVGFIVRIKDIEHLATKKQGSIEDQVMEFVENQDYWVAFKIMLIICTLGLSHHQVYEYLAYSFYKRVHLQSQLQLVMSVLNVSKKVI